MLAYRTHHELEEITPLIRTAPNGEGVAPTYFEHAPCFLKRAIGVGHVKETKGTCCGVKMSIRIRKLLSVTLSDWDAGVFLACVRNHGCGEVQPFGGCAPSRSFRSQFASPASDIQKALAGKYAEGGENRRNRPFGDPSEDIAINLGLL